MLNDILHVDQYRATDSETIRRIGNVLLFTCSIDASASGNTEAEVFADNASERIEFFRRAADMQAMEAEAKAEWSEK